MKLLFVIDRARATDDANINLVKSVLPCLTQAVHGSQKQAAPEIRFLGHTAEKNEAGAGCFYYGIDEAVRKLYFSLAELSPVRKLLRLACHPVRSAFGACKALRIDWIAGAYRRRIETLCEAWKPDAVIAVAAPFYTAKAVAGARVSCRKIIWMFDPYGTHYLMGGALAQWQEKCCFARVDKVFVPELLYPGYVGNSNHMGQANVAPMAFPGLIEPSEAGGTEKTKSPLLPRGGIQLVYVGSLYADIRNPAPLLRLARAMGEQVHLTIVGGLFGTYSHAFHEEFDAFLAGNVTLVGKVDRRTAQCYLQCADVLVNLGNLVDNQLPSKIFECFATGLPVLHLKQLAQCPAETYMKAYPLAHLIDTRLALTEQTVREAAAFCEENAGKRVPFAQVRALYPENTPEAVAKKLLAAVKGE